MITSSDEVIQGVQFSGREGQQVQRLSDKNKHAEQEVIHCGYGEKQKRSKTPASGGGEEEEEDSGREMEEEPVSRGET